MRSESLTRQAPQRILSNPICCIGVEGPYCFRRAVCNAAYSGFSFSFTINSCAKRPSFQTVTKLTGYSQQKRCCEVPSIAFCLQDRLALMNGERGEGRGWRLSRCQGCV